MGNFYITKPPRERMKADQDALHHGKAEIEQWFLDEKHYIKASTFIEKLPADRVVLRRWCQENLDGDVSVEHGMTIVVSSVDTWTFWFEFETDATAFKLRWEE